MREVKVKKWSVKDPDGKKVRDESTVDVIEGLLRSADPQNMPKGWDQFRLFHKVRKAIEESDKTGILKMEDDVYVFIKALVETGVPAAWGLNDDIYGVIDDIMNAKSSEDKGEKEEK